MVNSAISKKASLSIIKTQQDEIKKDSEIHEPKFKFGRDFDRINTYKKKI